MELYHDTSTDTLLYETTEQARILTHLSESRAVNGHMVGVPVNLRNLQILRKLDLPVIPIIRDSNYDWPHAPDITPLPHQKLMANFCVLNPYCCNLSDMGTMKTLSTLWALDWLMRQHPEGEFRALIVAPLSILERTWSEAIAANFLDRRTYKIVHGSEKARRRLLAEEADFYIINFDGLAVGARTRGRFVLEGFARDLHQRTDIRAVVIDEAGAYRDSRTRRHRVARVICKRDYLWALTGTPCPNGPPDAYGISKLVNDAFGESYTAFHNRTMVKVSQFRWIPKKDGYLQARRLLTPSIRFDIKDVWNGPPLTVQRRDVALTANQKHMLEELRSRLVIELEHGGLIDPVNEAAARTKFLQIVCGAVYDQDHEAHLTDARHRLDELLQVITNANGKILIFAPFTSVVHLIYKELKKHRITVAEVTGAVSKTDRTKIFADFQNAEDPRALVADPGCVSHGLDLWQAQTVIWYAPIDKNEQYTQGNARAHRPGQKYPVTIVQLTSTALEREIFTRLQMRQSQQGVMLAAVKRGLN